MGPASAEGAGSLGDDFSSFASPLKENEGTNSIAFTFNVENLVDISLEAVVSPASESACCSQESGAPTFAILK
jgi:hypothetical protein